MSIKQRLKAIETKAGIGSDVHIQIRHTIYEARSGGIDSEFFQASIDHPKIPDSFFCIHSTDRETEDEFTARVEAECLAAFGNLPNDWPETKP